MRSRSQNNRFTFLKLYSISPKNGIDFLHTFARSMGCYNSKIKTQESISRCKARRRYMKELLKARQSFSFSHSLYIHSLKSTGSALLQFANAESSYHKKAQEDVEKIHTFQKIRLPSSPPASTWTNSSSVAASSPVLPPPNPWDFWDPFAGSCSQSVKGEEEWEDIATTAASEVPISPSSSIKGNNSKSNITTTSNVDKESLEMVVSTNKSKKDLSGIVKDLDEYFVKAAEAGSRVSAFLEAPTCLQSCSNQGVLGKIGSYGLSLSSWGSNSMSSNSSGFAKYEKSLEEMTVKSHSSTIEKLYAWEKKLYLEVKNYESLRTENEKRVNLLRKQELKGADYLKVEKNKRAIESLESKLMVSSQAMETTSSEITRLRESELFPQLLQLLNCLTIMWRSMYECHQVQAHMVQQVTYTTTTSAPSAVPTSDMHRQSTLQLELEADRWHASFINLIKSQRDYIHSLSGWLRLSLFSSQPQSKPSAIYSLCEEWYLALDRIPDKVASEGIKGFLTVIRAIVRQQGEEIKQRKKSEASVKVLEKKMDELRALESKRGYDGTPSVVDRKAKVEALKSRAEEEKAKHEKSSCMTRAMTVNNLQTGLPNVFQAVTGFASVCMQVFEGVCDNQHGSQREMNLKLLT